MNASPETQTSGRSAASSAGWRGDAEFQARLIARYREHVASEPEAPDWGTEAAGFDYAAHRQAVAHWLGGIEYFARVLAEQLELHLEAEG